MHIPDDIGDVDYPDDHPVACELTNLEAALYYSVELTLNELQAQAETVSEASSSISGEERQPSSRTEEGRWLTYRCSLRRSLQVESVVASPKTK
jgi:hypothetical protein